MSAGFGTRALRAAAILLAGLAAALAALATMPAGARAEDLTALVSPLSGTTGSGFPMVGSSVPFGMIQPGPDTALADGSQSPVNYDGYAYHEPSIRGFSLTHFNGAGIMIAGDLPFMPTTGAVTASDPAANSSPYDHATEVALPGYYSATLHRYQTKVELTATQRASMMRITYPSTTQANLLLNSSMSIRGGGSQSSVTVVGDRGLRGWVLSNVGYKLYFSAVFDRPFSAFGGFDGSAVRAAARESAGNAAGAYLTFDTTANPTVTMRVAISYVDAAGADANLAAELPASRGFDTVRARAHDAWDARLHDAYVTGGDPGQRETFYTNLYRALQMPSIFDDHDGRYLGFDGVVRVVARGSHHYTNLSSWDTYRTQTPMLELIEPRVAHDLITSLLDDYDQNNQVIPRWTQANRDRGIMGGDSGSATVADGIVNRVVTGADARRAYAAVLHQATTIPGVWPREHLEQYVTKGYVPYDVSGIGAALTMEFAIDDNAGAQAAQIMGDTTSAAMLRRRAGSWRNIMDPGSQYPRPRNSDGSWVNPTDNIQGQRLPASVPWSPDFQDGYQEGTGWQYLWAVPQDVAGLAQAIGSPASTLSRLDTFFSTPLNQPVVTAVPVAQQYTSVFGVYYIGDQYTPANETDLWAPWYYDWLGQPSKTEQIVRAEMGTYNTRPDGLPGNDDTGTMSAWYVLAALGLYHAAPGTPVWELNSPAFAHETLRVGHNRRLQIDAPGAGAIEPFVQSATLGSAPLNRTYLTTCEIHRAGTIAIGLGPQASSWATTSDAAPPSLSDPAPRAPLAACLGTGA